MYTGEEIKFVREISGDDIIQENPQKNNQGIGPDAPPKDEYIMNSKFNGKMIV